VRIALAFQRRFYARLFHWLGPNASAGMWSGELAIKAPLLTAVSGKQTSLDVLADALRGTLGHEAQFLVPELQLRSCRPLNTWIYQNEMMHFDIGPGEKVLDIGSGGWPFAQATHLADLFPGATTHRTESLRRDGRPFLTIDVGRMPFRDKEWDFIFCSHVLEHLDRPGDACRELMRVGRKGYIEVPTRLSDVMLNFTRMKDHHRWHGLVLGRTIVFIEWQDAERRDVGTNYFFNALHSPYRNAFQRLFENNWPMFYAMLPWRDQFDFVVIDKEGRIVDREGSELSSTALALVGKC
jgi:SAM-dependent methyltransferase